MSDIKTITVNGTQYDIKDATTRADCSDLKSALNDRIVDVGNGVVDFDKSVSWKPGWIKTNGLIASSTASQFALVPMNAGETIVIGTRNSNITIIGSTTANDVNIGDTISVIKTTTTQDTFQTYTYTATEQINIVICVRASEYSLVFKKQAPFMDQKQDVLPYKFDELFSELQISETQNLYNKDTAVDGYIAANGTESESTTYCHSAKILVEVGKTYSFWVLYNGAVVSADARFLCAYDSDGNAVASAGSNSAVASYTVPDGIASIVVSFVQNRKHLFMVIEGTTSPASLLPYNIEHYIAKPSFITDAVGKILHDNESLKMTVDTASVGTDYKLAEHLDNKKNCAYSFFGKFASFTSIEIGHGKTESAANYLVIDGTNITSYRPNGTEYAHYAHNLSISDFISVSIKIADTPAQRATVTIITNGGSATIGNVIFFGCKGAIYFACGQETTGVDFAYSIMDLRKDVYVFGDSYISLADDKRWPNHAIVNKDNNMLLSGFPGAASGEEYPSVEKILSMGTPKYLCWFLGMNNPDSASGIAGNWVTIVSQVISTCKAKGIVPILATIPNTPTQRNTYKNAWVKASGERYVDFAKAVGAEDAGANWYAGMLSDDNVHPTAEGAKALWLQMRMDVPEIMQPTTT